ncbi:MAG TPA: hypothetical protein VLG76_03020 [Rhabdochlamydiaceae bacterium]|nr:hypothetical protein [Rhabdochlamydiaceae bacterium]
MIGLILFFAALPPLMQETKELKAILDDPRLSSSLKSELIQKIEKTEGGYLVSTASKQVQIKVKYLPATMPGPANFELIFQ